MNAITSGDEFGAAAEAGRGFESIRDYAMTQSGRPHIETDILNLEEHYYANPSTSIQQETARQTTLATLRAAINIGDVRKQGLAEARDAALLADQPIDVAGAVERVSDRVAAENAALAAAEAVHHDWALTAANIPLDVPLPEQVTDPTEFAALRHRLANALPGDTFEVTATGGETLTVEYDERFETDTGRTTYVLALDTPTSHSEQHFIAKDHITADVRAALFSQGAWADRRTATNPKLANVLARDYDIGLVEAAKPYTRQFDDFHAEYTQAWNDWKAVEGATLSPDVMARETRLATLNKNNGDLLRNIAAADAREGRTTNSAGMSIGAYRSNGWPHPDSVSRERDTFQRRFNREGVTQYLQLATADEQDLEAARVTHRAQIDAWEAEQAKREASAFRRLLPHAPRPALQEPEPRTTPHPFGGMTRDEWVNYEVENLTVYGQTDLSDFTTRRVRAPRPEDAHRLAPLRVNSPSILDEPLEPDTWGAIQDTVSLVNRIQQRPQTA